jgi:hypothetical protein
MEHIQELSRVGRREAPHSLEKGGANKTEEPTGECVPRYAAGVRRHSSCFLPDSSGELGQMGGGFLHPRCVLDDTLPLGFGPEDRLPKGLP